MLYIVTLMTWALSVGFPYNEGFLGPVRSRGIHYSIYISLLEVFWSLGGSWGLRGKGANLGSRSSSYWATSAPDHWSVPETLKVLCLRYISFLLLSYPSLGEDILLAQGLDAVRKQAACTA